MKNHYFSDSVCGGWWVRTREVWGKWGGNTWPRTSQFHYCSKLGISRHNLLGTAAILVVCAVPPAIVYASLPMAEGAAHSEDSWENMQFDILFRNHAYIYIIYICSKFINTYVYIYMKTKYVVLIVCHPERSLWLQVVAAHQRMLGHQDAPSRYIISRVSLCMLCIYIYIYKYAICFACACRSVNSIRCCRRTRFLIFVSEVFAFGN